MTELSSGHKYTEIEDSSVERLLLLDGEIMEQGGGYWVKFTANLVARTEGKPHGVKYALCLFDADNARVLCYDNAHPITVGNGPSKTSTVEHDHVHKGDKIKPYIYTSAETLMIDFWTDVDVILKEGGVP